ncbi:hypothetical protein VPH35_108958 [Triticum aestivum]
MNFAAVHMGFSGSPPPYLSLVAGSGEALGNTTAKKPVAADASMRGASFASGGSGVLDSTGDTINMTKQIEYFSDLKHQMLSARLGAFGASAFLSKSIFLMSAGSNDAIDFFSQDTSPDSTALQQFREAVVSTYDSHVKTLYNLGARKFAVIDVAPLGCCPYWRSRNPAGECVEPLNLLAKSLNDGIRDLFAGLVSEMQGMEYAIGSAYELVSSIVQDPVCRVDGVEERVLWRWRQVQRRRRVHPQRRLLRRPRHVPLLGLPAPYPGHLQARRPSVLRRAGAVRRPDHLQAAGRGVVSSLYHSTT